MNKNFSTEISKQLIVKDGTIVLSGYGISVKTEKGFLCLHEGLCEEQHYNKFSRPTCKIKRLVILGCDGFITLAAIKWLFGIGAGIIQIGLDGEVILASAPHREHILRKRAQYAAMDNQDGLKIARYLMTKKLLSQCRTISKHAPCETFNYLGETINTKYFINTYLQRVKLAKSISEVIDIESLTTFAYRQAVQKTSLRFKKIDRDYIPIHWLTFGSRNSQVNPKSNHNATSPANAMLNYLYALLHSETCIAVLGAGLDPYAGIIHKDKIYRASFAYDMMEVARPEVDDWLLDFVSTYTFSRRDFYQLPDGGVRLAIPLARRLAETIALWRKPIIAPLRYVIDQLSAGSSPE